MARRNRRPFVAGAVVLVLVVGAATLAWRATSGSRDAGAATTTTSTPRQTATVVRRNLVDTTTVSGTLTYGDTRSLRVTGSSSGTGTGADAGTGTGAGTGTPTTTAAPAAQVVTALPAAGTVLRRGQTVFEVNGGPGPALLYGPRPMWRTLQSGVTDGLDVAQLELNLTALGFTNGGALTVDQTFTTATATAIGDWQVSRGLTRTGVLAPADVVIQPGAVRVATLTAAVGDQVSGEIMRVTGTVRLVKVALDPVNSKFVTVGGRVNLTLADSSTVVGRVQRVGTTAVTSTQGQGADATASTTLDLWIALVQPAKGALDESPVSVELVTSRATNVLAVPVSALVALTEGGYAVEVTGAGGATRLVAVQTGKFAGGFVEVSGALRAGDKVVVA